MEKYRITDRLLEELDNGSPELLSLVFTSDQKNKVDELCLEIFKRWDKRFDTVGEFQEFKVSNYMIDDLRNLYSMTRDLLNKFITGIVKAAIFNSGKDSLEGAESEAYYMKGLIAEGSKIISDVTLVFRKGYCLTEQFLHLSGDYVFCADCRIETGIKTIDKREKAVPAKESMLRSAYITLVENGVLPSENMQCKDLSDVISAGRPVFEYKEKNEITEKDKKILKLVKDIAAELRDVN